MPAGIESTAQRRRGARDTPAETSYRLRFEGKPMKLNTALAAVLALSTTACVVHDDGFRDHLAKGCHSKEECHTLAIQAHNRNAKCKKSSCRDEAEDEQTANALETPYVNQPSSSASSRPVPPATESETYARELTRVQHVGKALRGDCEDDATVERELAAIPPIVTEDHRAGLTKVLRREATARRNARWGNISSDIFSAIPRTEHHRISNIEDVEANLEASRAQLSSLRCEGSEYAELPRLQTAIEGSLAGVRTERACRASDDCMAKRYAQPLCSALELKRNTAKEMARERANPSGVVNLTALNDLGRQSQDAEESIAEARKEYASKTKKPFDEKMCK